MEGHCDSRVWQEVAGGKMVLKSSRRWEVGLQNKWEVRSVGGGRTKLATVGR